MIKTRPNLTKEEALEYVKFAKLGDEKSKEILIESNIRTGLQLAKQFTTSEAMLEDLCQEACVGICIAIDKFDIYGPTSFSTYATYWIRHRIYEYISTQTQLSIKSTSFYKAVKIKKTQQDLNLKLNRSPTIEEIAEAADVTKEKVLQSLKCLQQSDCYEDMEKELETPDVAYDFVIASHRRDLVEDATKTVLTPKERQVIERRFGLNGCKPMTLQEVGDELGLSKERIRQIENKSLKKIATSQYAKQMKELI